MNPLISVIVPIYNVEKYLSKCIDSIINQTYKNLEIILVDDGSPDNCPKICDEYEKKDSRIKVIHKENGGLSDARNAGMKIAKGEYISFIDSDDFISENFINILYRNLSVSKCDIAECDIVKFVEDENPVEQLSDKKPLVVDTEKGLSMLIAENEFHQYVTNKLYKSELIKGIYFEKGKLHEDEFWTYRIFGRARSICKIYDVMYFYFQRQNSIMGVSFNLKRLDSLEAKVQRQKYIDKNYPSVANQAKIDLFGTCIFMCQSALKFMNGSEKKKAIGIINKCVKDNQLKKIDISSLQDKNHFWFGFAQKCFILCCKIRSMTGVGF